MMPTVAKKLQSLYSAIHLVDREGTTIELMEGIEHGENDLAITLLPINNQMFKCEKIAEKGLILVVSSSYPVFTTRVMNDQ